MVILAEQQTVAMNPRAVDIPSVCSLTVMVVPVTLLATLPSEENLTVMVVAVTGGGMKVPENVWVVEPAITSTVS